MNACVRSFVRRHRHLNKGSLAVLQQHDDHHQPLQRTLQRTQLRGYFTNGDRIKKEDPYSVLGLSWGDGASTADIKAAFRKKAQELHPDVNKTDSPQQALLKFQDIQKAYQTLIKAATGVGDTIPEEWQFAMWTQADRIANDRDDVAGVMRKRPAQPAAGSTSSTWGVKQLGHPDGRGVVRSKRAEFLSDGGNSQPRTSSVGRGNSKWVTKRKHTEYKPYDPTSATSTSTTTPTTTSTTIKASSKTTDASSPAKTTGC